MSGCRLGFEHLRRHAATHAGTWDEIDLVSPIDRSRPFLCASLTPLYYSNVYARLSPAQRLRYNQLTGLAFNEVIRFFETHFAQNILAAVAGSGALPRELREALARFAEDERRHTAAFRALNRLSEPGWYENADQVILRPSPALLRAVRFLTRRPALFPAVLWIALVMEEKSLAISTALLRAGAEVIEPHYLAVHRAHLQDEIRHVHLDWHMLDHLYARRPRWLRLANARLFGFFLRRFFLTPAYAGRRVIEILLQEFPELHPLAPRLFRALCGLERDPAYHRMMYSRQVTPITFQLFDRFAELHPLAENLLSYTPRLQEESP